MEAEPKRIDFYVLRNGKAPFERWLNGLRDRRARARINARLARVHLGNLGEARDLGSQRRTDKIIRSGRQKCPFARRQSEIVFLSPIRLTESEIPATTSAYIRSITTNYISDRQLYKTYNDSISCRRWM
jgi:hypothetical protein